MLDLRLLPVGPVGYLYLVLICLYLPWAVWRSSRRARAASIASRTLRLLNTVQTATFFGLLALLAGWQEGVALFPAKLPPAPALLAGLAAVPLLLLAMLPYREKVARGREPRMQLFCEPQPRDRALWLLVAASAGFWEEIVYRGVATVLLLRLTGSVPAALAISVVVFAAAHLHRGWTGAATVAPIALVFHILVYLAGSLYVAMAVHFLYDALAGFDYMRLARKYGITRAAPAA